MQKFSHVFLIFGGRKIKHLHVNIKALGIAPTTEQVKFLDVAFVASRCERSIWNKL